MKRHLIGAVSAAALAPLAYPVANGTPAFRYNDFRNVLGSNPCLA
jgi:hypothetical protein